MSRLRTKVLTWCAGLVGFMLVTPFALPAVISYLFAKFPRKSTIFVSLHVHPASFITCVALWAAFVVCAGASSLYDKRHGSGQ